MANALHPVATGLRPPSKFTIKTVSGEPAQRIRDKAQQQNYIAGVQGYRRGVGKLRSGPGSAPLL